MSMPERLRAWCQEDSHNHRIIIALMEGAIAGSRGISIAQRTNELKLVARSAEGDAFETGWEYGKDLQLDREETKMIDPYAHLVIDRGGK